jgi:hypothetical protein
MLVRSVFIRKDIVLPVNTVNRFLDILQLLRLTLCIFSSAYSGTLQLGKVSQSMMPLLKSPLFSPA